MATDAGKRTRDFEALLSGGSVTALTDGELLARFVAQRDRRAGELAFEALVIRHGPMVWGVCRRALADPTDADDAFQATFLVLVRRARSIRVEGSGTLGRWLHVVSRRVAARTRADRDRRRRRESAGVLSEQVATQPGAPGDVEALAALDDEVARLAEPFRSAVVLCDLDGLTHEQAALAVGCPVGTIKSRLARGRDRLHDRLARRGFHPDGATAILAGRAIVRPAVPSSLVGSVGRAAATLAAGAPTAELRRIVSLGKGMDPAMISTPWKWLVGTTLGMGLSAAGWTWVAGQGTGPRPIEGPPPAVATPPASGPAAATPPAATPSPPAAGDPAATDIAVEARDAATDAPVAGVAIHLEAKPTGQVESATTDASGVVRFRVRNPRGLERLSLTTGTENGFVPLAVPRAFFGQGETLAMPDRVVLRVERGVAIGGRVVAPAGRPVAGASVVVEIKKDYPGANQYVNLGDPVTTDADGRWSIPNAPAHPDSVKVAAFHSLHRTDISFYHAEEVKDLATLGAGSAVVTVPDRGTILDGMVVDPASRPVAGAEVTLGGGYGFGDSLPPIRSDAQGRFQFGVRPGTKSNLTATHPGFGPAGVKVQVGTEPRQVTLTLPPAATLSGQVVDPAGKPIPRTQVILAWQPGDLGQTRYREMPVGFETSTDAEGRFAWPEAPPGDVRAEVYAGGYMGQEKLTLTTGAANRITLTGKTKVRGTVVDAATGAPITGFGLFPGAAWRPGERLIWQRADLFDVARPAAGTFEFASEMPFHQLAVRVDAGDYFAEESALVPSDGSTHDLTFRLTRGEPVTGRVVAPDGSPAVGATVYLDRPDDSHRIENGAITSNERDQMTHIPVVPDGSFRLPPQRKPFALVALSDAGVAMIPVGGFRSGATVPLLPWASVAGTCKLADAPGEGFNLSRDRSEPSKSTAAGFPTEEQVDVRVDAAGRFAITRLTPGRHVLGRWVPNGAEKRVWFQTLATIDARPGQTLTLHIGATGRAVTGRLHLPPLPAGQTPMIRLAAIEPTAPADPTHGRGVRLAEDGRFRAEDLLPGAYALKLAIHEPPSGDACGWGRLLGRFEHRFTVAGLPGDGPVDLGTLEPVEAPGASLKVGDLAPPFRVEGLDGKPINLDDLRGQFVLVDFWATWCAPCMAELPNLKVIQREFAADPKFRVVSLSLDEDQDLLRRVVEAEGLTWPQARVGPDSPVVSAYGTTAVPATFLVGPDGRIIAKDLRGDALRQAVAKALGGR